MVTDPLKKQKWQRRSIWADRNFLETLAISALLALIFFVLPVVGFAMYGGFSSVSKSNLPKLTLKDVLPEPGDESSASANNDVSKTETTNVVVQRPSPIPAAPPKVNNDSGAQNNIPSNADEEIARRKRTREDEIQRLKERQAAEEEEKRKEELKKEKERERKARSRQGSGRIVKNPEFRDWTSGKFSIYARFHSLAGSKVKLEKEDNTIITVDIEQLSNHDRKYIEKVKRTGKR